MISSEPGYSKSIILNVGDCKDMSVLIKPFAFIKINFNEIKINLSSHDPEIHSR